MTRLGFFAVVVLVTEGGIGILSPSGPKKRRDNKELEKFKGNARLPHNGDGEAEDESSIRFLRSRATRRSLPGQGIRSAARFHEARPGKRPAHLGLTYEDGPQRGRPSRGVYKFEGDTHERLYGRFGQGTARREFASKAGSGNHSDGSRAGKVRGDRYPSIIQALKFVVGRGHFRELLCGLELTAWTLEMACGRAGR